MFKISRVNVKHPVSHVKYQFDESIEPIKSRCVHVVTAVVMQHHDVDGLPVSTGLVSAPTL